MTNNKIKVLSLFDGISGARQALKELNIDCDYYASEINKYAIKVANHNHPDIVQIGDVKDLSFHYDDRFRDVVMDFDTSTNKQGFCGTSADFDLLVGGFPCQSYSMAGNRKGIEDERGQLIYDVFRILKECKPKYFLLENVKGLLSIDKGETFKNILKDLVDCGYIVNWKVINSALMTAQNRQRVYIIGSLEDKIEIEDPEDKGIYLKDIVNDWGKNGIVYSCAQRGRNIVDGKRKDCKGAKTEQRLETSYSEKANTLTTVQKDSMLLKDYVVRKLTPIECCRLQGFPDNYFIDQDGNKIVSNTQAYKALGNSFTVPVIKHLIQSMIK